MALSCFNCSLLSQISFSEFKFISPILNPVHSVHGYTCPVDDMLQLSILQNILVALGIMQDFYINRLILFS